MREDQIEGVLQVASSVDIAEGAILPFHGYLLGGTAGVGAVALLCGWYLTRKSLNPVKVLTRTAEAIYRVGDLSRRIEVGKGRDEIKTLGRTFNRMLDSIEQLVTSQHRFLADASHELKTPLTVIRGNAEILCRGASSGDDGEAADAILREATRMQRIVDDLLAIAELDAATEMRFELVEVRALAERAVHDLEPLAGSRKLRVRGTARCWSRGTSTGSNAWCETWCRTPLRRRNPRDGSRLTCDGTTAWRAWWWRTTVAVSTRSMCPISSTGSIGWTPRGRGRPAVPGWA